MNFKTTKEIKVSKNLVDQIIGQDQAVNLIKKAAKQKRHVVSIGASGTGKSMLGQALSELLPKEKLTDILSIPNTLDENSPKIKTISKGLGKNIITRSRLQTTSYLKYQNILFFILVILAMITPWWIRKQYGDILAAAALISSMLFLTTFIIFMNLNRKIKIQENTPKLLIDNSDKDQAPFIDCTGAHAGALLGDVLHDPLQSGGLGTPAHERLIPGAIHKANKGVLFVDEIATLKPEMQQELLTVLQEKKYPITGQSERSSGAMVRSEPVPADFILVAAGTLDTVKQMHPALRSRIRGYGYEVYMNETMPDTKENIDKLARFVAQEIKKDKKIPHFTRSAVDFIIQEARKRSGKSNSITLRLRELGGLIRAAGDVAKEENLSLVTPLHIQKAKSFARTLEQQIADKYIENKKEYQIISVIGTKIGHINGLAVIGSKDSFSGIVLPIESEITKGNQKTEFIATGQLGKIAKEAVKNVSAIILKYFGEDIKEYTIFTQFLQTESGVEGDSASIAVATSIISALKQIPIRQDTALTGSLSVRGDVLAVGGITQKVEAAIEARIPRVIIPKSNEKDVLLTKEDFKKIKIIPASTIKEVLKESLDWKGKEDILEKIK